MLGNGKFDLCEQVKSSLLERMDRIFSAGSARLPSEKQLADRLQVSRGTVRAALAELESEGRIFRRHGSGTYLNTRVSEVSPTLYPHAYFSELIARNGYAPSIRILNLGTLKDEKISTCLEVEPDCELVCLQKLYLADGKMCIFIKDYFDKRIFSQTQLALMKREPVSIYQFFIKHTDRTVGWDLRRMGVTDTLKTPELAQYANLPADGVKPYLWINSTTYDKHDRPMFMGDAYMDTEMINLYLFHNQMKDQKVQEEEAEHS